MFFGYRTRKLRMVVSRFSSRSRKSKVAGITLGFFIIFTTFKLAPWTQEGEAIQETTRKEQSIYGDEMHAGIHVRLDTCHFCMGALLYAADDVITSHVCKADGRDDEAERDNIAPHTLFVIITSEERGRYRKTLRQTWLQHTRFNKDADYRHVFYMGIKNGKTVSSAVKLEQYVHGDLMVGNFTDNSANETVKLMKALSYPAFKCRNAERVLVTTDHVLFNKTQYLHYLRRHRLHTAVGGQCMYGLTVDHLDKTSPWYATKDENPWGYYPDFCLANAMLIEISPLHELVYQSIGIPFFRIPSIYLGFVMDYLKVKAVTMDGFYACMSDYDPCTSPSGAAVIQLDDRVNLTALWTTQCSNSKLEQSSPRKEGTNQVHRTLAPYPGQDVYQTRAAVISSANKLPVKAKKPPKQKTDSPPVNAKVAKKPRPKSSPVKWVKRTLSPGSMPVKATIAIETWTKPMFVKRFFAIKQKPKSSPAKTTIALEQHRISRPVKRENVRNNRTRSSPFSGNIVILEQQRKAPSKKDVTFIKRKLKPKRKDSL
ncbi:uncharacterized protein LOC135482786 [Lineus longissimus]|uniref:uncharacterized protein LOC135482786 n=1 Tax=Lineus longissimus TaxID=88925 RepID=UPI00315D9DDF